MSVKLHEAFCMDSFMDRLLFFDDFHGDQIQNEWDSHGNAGGSAVVVDAQTGGIVRLTSDTDIGDGWFLDWGANPNEVRSLLVTKRVTMEFRCKVPTLANTTIRNRLLFDGDNFVEFEYDTAQGHTDWWIKCRDGGAETDLNSGVAVNTDYHIFRIECHTHTANHVHFYIDGTQTANSPINTNVPDDPTDYLMPWFAVITRTTAARTMDIDYCYIRQER